MAIGVKGVITIAVSLIVVALVLPLGLGLLAMAGSSVMTVANATGLNESAILISDVLDPSVLTLLTILIPILAVIGIAVGFISTRD